MEYYTTCGRRREHLIYENKGGVVSYGYGKKVRENGTGKKVREKSTGKKVRGKKVRGEEVRGKVT